MLSIKRYYFRKNYFFSLCLLSIFESLWCIGNINSPIPGKGDRIEVDLGPDLTIRLRDYCKVVGESADVVLRQSAREMIRKEMIEGATVVDLLRKRMEELRFRHDEDSNA